MPFTNPTRFPSAKRYGEKVWRLRVLGGRNAGASKGGQEWANVGESGRESDRTAPETVPKYTNTRTSTRISNGSEDCEFGALSNLLSFFLAYHVLMDGR